MIKKVIRTILPSCLLCTLRVWRDNLVIAKGKAVLQKYRKKHPRKRNEKCRIVFIVQRTEVFNSVRTIAEAASKDARCEVYLLPLPRCKNNGSKLNWDSYDDVVQYCKGLGIGTVLQTKDPESGMLFNLSKLNPDYVFLSVPYTRQYPEPYQIANLARITKVCYVPYGYSFLESHLHLAYDDAFILQLISFVFSTSQLEYNFIERKIRLFERLHGKFVYNLGFPRFDLLCKTDKETPTVLWLPRWTANVGYQAKNEQSSFLRYKSDFLSFAERHPEARFVIRPHPLMFENYKSCGIMSEEEISSYIERIQAMENTCLDTSPDYLPALNGASVLLSDFTSLLAEYYTTEQPIVFTGNTDSFSPYDREMIDTFYLTDNWLDVERTLDGLLSGTDPKAEMRKEAVNRFMRTDSQTIGASILNVLINDFKKERQL